MDGCRLMFSRDEPYRTGDFVVIHRKPEFVKPGDFQSVVKKLIMAPLPSFWSGGDSGFVGLKPMVAAEMLNPKRVIYYDPNTVAGIHKCLGICPPERLASEHPISDEDVRRKYPRRQA